MIAQRRKATLWQRYFEALGHEVINPFELADQLRKKYIIASGNEPTYHEYLDYDLCNVDSCTHIFLCEGWPESFGCMEEVDRSIENGITFLFERNFKLQ